MENKKYEMLMDDSLSISFEYGGVWHTLYRIRALRDFGNISKGTIGGYIESEKNLSHNGNCWAEGNAKVYGDACVYDNAEVYGTTEVYGVAEVVGEATVRGEEDYIVFKNWWSSGRYFTWTRSNNRWKVGCFYGTGKELIKRAYADSERSGREYERIVKYVEEILKDERE